MIVGTGVDLVEISRIRAAAVKELFLERVYTVAERDAGIKNFHRLAGFFAAKEALLKAMGTGLAGFSWQEIEVAHNLRGAPFYRTSGRVARFLTDQKVTKIHLSISHCREYAVAQAVLEAEA